MRLLRYVEYSYTSIIEILYNSDINGSPEDPVVCGLSVTEIHTGVQLADLADVQPAAALVGLPVLLRHSLDTLALYLVPNDVCVVAAV